uniref:Chemokine interleukin-8-like domain-containing protein n=1 Tax=Pygocentrus nattereri TaxID=42514 RepID=A0AAR2J858_PYGNA
MKMSCVCLVLGLVLLMTISSDAAPQALQHPVNRCFDFTTFQKILKVIKTHSSCPNEGFVNALHTFQVSHSFCHIITWILYKRVMQESDIVVIL